MLLCQESTQQGAIKQEMMPINIREKMLEDEENVFKTTFKSHFYIMASLINSNIKKYLTIPVRILHIRY